MVEILHGWSESQRKMRFFLRSRKIKHLEEELERMSTLPKSSWQPTYGKDVLNRIRNASCCNRITPELSVAEHNERFLLIQLSKVDGPPGRFYSRR